MPPNRDAILDDIANMNPGGSLAKLDANVLLLHVVPYLGIYGSLTLASTSKYYRSLVLYHALAHNTIPAHALLDSLQPAALAAIRNIHIESPASALDIQTVMRGNTLPALRSLKISPAPGRYHQILAEPNPGLQRVIKLTIDSATAKRFVAHPNSAGMLRNLLSLTIEHTFPFGQCPTPLPEHLLRALGPTSQLTTLEISSDKGLHSARYHDSILALLTALSIPESVPQNLSLLGLCLPITHHSEKDGLSIIVAARKSSLAHPIAAWRLKRLPCAPLIPGWAKEIWNEGCDAESFLLTQAELDEIIAIDQQTWDRSRLTNFFASPVIVTGTTLKDVGLLGTSLHGIEFNMSTHKTAPPYFVPSLTCMALKFVADAAVSADPKPWLRVTAPHLRSVELIASWKREDNYRQYPKIYQLFKLPAMPNLRILRLDIKLLLAVGTGQECGRTKEPHGATKYEFGWIPSVPKLRMDGWWGCSVCWGDRGEGTMRHFIENGAGGAGKATVRGEFDLFGEEDEEGFGREWEVMFYNAEYNL